MIQDYQTNKVYLAEGIKGYPKVAENPSPSSLKPTVIGDVLEVDKTVHDFGDITEDQGPQACTFTIKNISDSPIAIYEVVSSCGCTEATWTREPLQPGKTGTVSATYKNEDGPIPFDKTLTVYVSAMKKPFLLRLRGSVHGKKMSLKEIYGNHLCQGLGLKETTLKGGNMEQGESRSDQIMVANLGRKPITVSFTDVSDNLKMEVEPNPIPAGSTAVMSWTVTSSRSIWGRHEYLATPVVNGTPCTGTVLKVWAVTKENFAGMTEEERRYSQRVHSRSGPSRPGLPSWPPTASPTPENPPSNVTAPTATPQRPGWAKFRKSRQVAKAPSMSNWIQRDWRER